MTDNIKELVRELNFQAGTWDDNPTVTGKEIAARYRKAASALTALSNQIERMRGALLNIIKQDQKVTGTTSEDAREYDGPFATIARAALGKDTPDDK